MKLSVPIIAAACAASASAAAVEQLEKKQATTPAPFNTQSAFLVLATALPSSILTQAVADPSVFSSEVASEFKNSMTPGWFSSLPTDVKTYLLMQSTATSGGSVPTALAPTPRASASGMMPYGTNSTGPYATGSGMGTGASTPAAVTVTDGTNVTSTAPGPRTSTSVVAATSSGGNSMSAGTASQAGATTARTASSSGMAAVPTAAIGAGIGAAMGMLGMLAL